MNHNKLNVEAQNQQGSKTKLSKKLLRGVTATAAMLILVAGCANSSESKTSESEVEQGSKGYQVYKKEIKKMEENKDINIFTYKPESELTEEDYDDYATTYLTAELVEKYGIKWDQQPEDIQELHAMDIDEFAKQPYEDQVKYCLVLFDDYVEKATGYTDIMTDVTSGEPVKKRSPILLDTVAVNETSSIEEVEDYLKNVASIMYEGGETSLTARRTDERTLQQQKLISLLYNPHDMDLKLAKNYAHRKERFQELDGVSTKFYNWSIMDVAEMLSVEDNRLNEENNIIQEIKNSEGTIHRAVIEFTKVTDVNGNERTIPYYQELKQLN